MNTPNNNTHTASGASTVQNLLDRGYAFAADIKLLLHRQEAPDAPTCASLAMNYEIWYKQLHDAIQAHAPHRTPDIEADYMRACGKCPDTIACMLSEAEAQCAVLSRIADALLAQLSVLKALQEAIV